MEMDNFVPVDPLFPTEKFDNMEYQSHSQFLFLLIDCLISA